MRVMHDAINWDDVATMNEVCAVVGIAPPPVQEWVDELDFDPDAMIAQLESLLAAHDTVTSTSATFDQAGNATGVLEGATAAQLALHADCQRNFWDQVGDFLLWVVENLLQLIDYIVDFLCIVVAWITFIATAFSVVAAVIIFIVGLAGGGGIGAALAALVDSVILAVAGAIAIIGIIISLLSGLNWVIEWLQEVIRDARGSICGDGLPSLPDWDPEGWEPPVWPV